MSSNVRPIALAWLEQAGERRYVESETRIGRGEQNDIRLGDPSVSRDHALIRRVDGVYVISDLDSNNGTFVNDQRVYAPRPLSKGDRIRLAETTFIFDVDLPESAGDTDKPQPLATSISQFLTLSGQIDVQNYLQGELRVVTVLFLDLCGFTALSERISPDEVTLVVNQCFQHLTETAIRFGGFVDKYIGDAMMVLFGSPEAHDDDAERAVRAAIAMQEELARYSERLRQRSGITLQMRVGINTGEVLAGEIGSGQFSAFTVMGDAVNLASRLEGHARVDHILVSETTYQLTKHRVRYEALPAAAIRGKNELVATYEVLGQVEGDGPAADGPFVGREHELETLEAMLWDGGGLRTVIVTGPAGIGKSRLIDELGRRQADGAHSVLVRGQERIDVAALREKLPDTGPIILVVDRIELASAPTKSGLQLLIRELVDADVLLVLLTRGGAGADWPGHPRVLELRELPTRDARELVRRLLPLTPPEPGTVDQIITFCGGSPLVIERIVSAARASGMLERINDTWRLHGPIDVRPLLSLRSLVQAGLDQLSMSEPKLLRMASLVGRPWTERLIDVALGEPVDLDQTLKHLVELGLLVRTGELDAEYQFHDEATRAVVEASLPQVERRRLHERIASALQREYDPTRPDHYGLKRIAQHLARAGQHWQAVEYLLRSADLAVASAPGGAAVEQYRAALEDAHQVTDQKQRTRFTVEIQERLGDALLADGSLPEAQIAFEAAASAASPEREAELHLKLALTGVRRGNPQRVLDITGIVLEQSGAVDSSRVTAEALAALSLTAQGDLGEAHERIERAQRLPSVGLDAAALGLAHFASGRAAFVAGNLASARHELELSVAFREQVPNRLSAVGEAHLLLGLVLCELGELDAAEASVRQVLTAGRAPDRWNRATLGLVLGRVLRTRGDTRRATRHVQEALASAEASGARELALELNLELAAMDELALDAIRSALATAVARQLHPVACSARVRLADALRAQSAPVAAWDVTTREALTVAHEAALLSRGMGLALHEAAARRALGDVLAQTGNWSRAEREFEGAASIQERQGAAVELVRTLVAQCRAEHVYASSPRPGQIRARLARASEMAEGIGMNREREEVLNLLAALQD